MPVSTSAIIIRSMDNKFFVAKRSKNKEYSPGKWELIGGNLEPGETEVQGLCREVNEELGVDIKEYKYFRDYQFKNRVFKVYITELAKEPRPNKDDFEEWGWYGIGEIKKMDFAINCQKRIIDYDRMIKNKRL